MINFLYIIYKFYFYYIKNETFLFSVMTTATAEKTEGLKALQNACDEIQKTIAHYSGIFQIKMAVCIKIIFKNKMVSVFYIL